MNAFRKTKTTGEERKGGWPRQRPRKPKKNSFDNKLLAEVSGEVNRSDFSYKTKRLVHSVPLWNFYVPTQSVYEHRLRYLDGI